jgi:hypothetical protein
MSPLTKRVYVQTEKKSIPPSTTNQLTQISPQNSGKLPGVNQEIQTNDFLNDYFTQNSFQGSVKLPSKIQKSNSLKSDSIY